MLRDLEKFIYLSSESKYYIKVSCLPSLLELTKWRTVLNILMLQVSIAYQDN